MADMYGVNIGGINAPASEDYNAAASAIVQGGKNTAGAISFLGGLVAQTFTAVKDVDMEQKIRENKEAFTQFDRKQQLSQAEQGLQQATEEKKKLISTGQINKFKAQDDIINTFIGDTKKLEDALAQKQISLQRYLGNVQTLTRQWIAQFPGRADEIRQQVGQLTGIKNADDFAYQTYLEQQMNMQLQTRTLAIEEAKRQAALEEKTAEDLYKNGFYPDRQTALKEFRAGKATDAVFAVQRINQYNTITDTAEKEIKNSNNDVIKRTNAAGVAAFIDAAKITQISSDEFKPLLAKIPSFYNNDGSVNLVTLAQNNNMLIPYIEKLKANVINGYNARAEQLRFELTQSNVSATNIEENVNKIYTQRDNTIKSLESKDGLVALKTVEKLLVSNRASLQDNLTAVDIENKNLSSAGTQKFMLMYSSPDQIELLKQQFPNVYTLINRGFENMANAQDRARAIYAGAGFKEVLKVEEHITSNGSLPPTNNVEDAKANSEIANILGKSAIRELAEKSIVPTPENARLSAGFIETALKDRGPRLNDALKEEANIKAAIANMPDGIKAEYLANVNKHIENVISPQGQLANNVGVLAKVRKSADAVIPKDSSGTPQSLVKLQVDANGFITPLIEPNPAYKAPKGLLEGATPQGKKPTSRTGMTTVPAPSARPSMVTVESNKELVNAGREVNNVVTIAAAASATERKAMAQRFVDAFNTVEVPAKGEPNAPTKTTTSTTSGKSPVDSSWIYQQGR